MIKRFREYSPQIHHSCFTANNVEIIGDVVLKKNSNIWFNTVIRGDFSPILVGQNTNIQDNCTLHSDTTAPLNIGDNVTVGHGTILHGCDIGNNSLIGMGSIILNNARIGEFTIIGAGSLVTQNKEIPSGVLCMGSPAKVIRKLTKEEKDKLINSANKYVELSKEYKQNI